MKKLKATTIKGIKIDDANRYILDFTRDKKRYRKSISVSSIEEAQIALTNFKKELDFQDNIDVDIHSTVNEYWETLRTLKQWKSKQDTDLNKHYILNIQPILGNLKITDVKSKHFTKLNLSQIHLGTRSQKKSYEILQPMFNLAIEDELIVHTPIKKIHIPVRKQLEEKKIITDASLKFRCLYEALHKFFGSDQLITINNHPTIKTVQCNNNPHHLALFLFGFHGRRLNEILSLKWSDINIINRSYIVRGTNSKVNLDMTFKLDDDIKNALDRVEQINEYVFQVKKVDNYYNRIRAISALPEFTFHWMRNLLVSALSSQGTSTTHLSALLGHTDSNTLKKYLSLQRESSTAITSEATTNLLGLTTDYQSIEYWEAEIE